MAETDNEKLKKSRPGATAEVSAGVTGSAGLYRHPESGQEAATKFDPLYGDAQSEAFLRTGFVRVGDVPEGYAKEMVPGSVEADEREARKGASLGQVKGIEARLDAVESTNAALEAENARLRAQVANPVGEGFPGESKVKEDGQAHVDDGGATGESSGVVSGTENTPDSDEEVKSLDKQNTTELKATAETEGVELTDEENTNAKIRSAIQAKREESEN